MFIGIPLEPAAISELWSVTMPLHSQAENLRWSTPESWHITLQFLGNTSQERYACLITGLSRIHLPPFPIRLGALGFFNRAGIFFIEVQISPELLELQQEVTKATALCGFVPEPRAYHPHVTLARAKGSDVTHGLDRLKTGLPRLQQFTGFLAETFLLYESFTAPTGSRYEIRERFSLQQH